VDIEHLYELIPDFMCSEGCYECCKKFGVPSRTQVEDQRIREYLRAHGLQPGEVQGTTCPYLNELLPEGGCEIYPVRPLICRLYGTAPNYLCKKGVRPLRLLLEDEEEDILSHYQKNFF